MKFLKLFSLVFLTFNLSAQKFDWKGRIGGIDSDTSVSIQLDPSGNLYTSGIFYGQIDLNQDTIKNNNFTSNGLSDFYIQKTNPFGEFLWGKQFGADSIDRITNVKYFDGKLYISGQFSKSILFDKIELKSNGELDAFVAVLDTSGSVLWAKSFGGLKNDNISSMNVNESGIYFSGIFSANQLEQSANGSVLISKLSLDGLQSAWTSKISENYKVKPNSISFDSKGNLFLVGSFAGDKIDFNPSSKKDSLLSSEKKPNTDFFTQDCFLLKLSSSGEFQFVKKIGGTTGDDIIYDSYSIKGKFAITGQINGSVLFGGPNGKLLKSKGGVDIFVALYNENLDLLWAVNTGGPKEDKGKSIFLDSNLNVYSTGIFFDGGQSVDFDPSSNVFNLNSASSPNAFVWKLSSNGEFLYAGSFGGSGVDNGSFVYANDEEEIFTTGEFEGTATFYGDNLKSIGKSDVYLLKSVLDKENGYVIDYALKGMIPDSLPFRLEVYKKDIGNYPWYNNQYIDVKSFDSDGDKNTVLIDSLQGKGLVYASKACSTFKVEKKEDWYLPSTEELELMYQNRKKIGGLKKYSYWSSTENDKNNSISIDFSNGNKNTLSDKADRKYVRPVRKKMKNDGLNSNNIISFDLFPNPTNGESEINLDSKYVQNGISFQLIDATGKVLIDQTKKSNTFKIDLSSVENGVYFVRLWNSSFNAMSKIIKE